MTEYLIEILYIFSIIVSIAVAGYTLFPLAFMIELSSVVLIALQMEYGRYLLSNDYADYIVMVLLWLMAGYSMMKFNVYIYAMASPIIMLSCMILSILGAYCIYNELTSSVNLVRIKPIDFYIYIIFLVVVVCGLLASLNGVLPFEVVPLFSMLTISAPLLNIATLRFEGLYFLSALLLISSAAMFFSPMNRFILCSSYIYAMEAPVIALRIMLLTGFVFSKVIQISKTVIKESFSFLVNMRQDNAYFEKGGTWVSVEARDDVAASDLWSAAVVGFREAFEEQCLFLNSDTVESSLK